MDTSENYILMCDKAKDIQDKWVWQLNPIGDYCWLGHDYLKCAVQLITKPFIQLDGRIWLPRQDQLQDMIWHKMSVSASGLIRACVHFSDELNHEDSNTKYSNRSVYTTMEQLWLAFVMKEKYNKVWNGEDWVKE